MANSVDEWLTKAAQAEAAARQLVRPGAPVISRALVLQHVGFSVEFALKAWIMRHQGLNRWPERSDPGDYWTHDLTKLRKKVGWKITPTDPVAPNWSVLMAWSRQGDYAYSPSPTPLPVAKSYIDAAYGSNGVVTWIRSQLTPTA